MKHRPALTVLVLSVFALFASGCVTTDIASKDKAAVTKPAVTLAASNTANECAFDQAMLHMGKIVGDGIVLGTYGAMEGAFHGAIAGSASEYVIIGAAVGGAVGLGIGTYKAVRDYKPEPCTS